MAARKPARSPKPSARRKAVARKPAARKPAARAANLRATAGASRRAPARRPPRPAAATRPAAMEMNAPNGQPAQSGIGLVHHHMDYSTHDPEAMKRFFTEVLGFTNVLYIPEHRYLTVFITPTSSFGFMPPMSSAPEQWQPPGEPNFYFFVADVDRSYAELCVKGVNFDQPPTDMPWGHRLAVFRDPEGRRMCLAQRLG
jgi:predicted enzyme related to lactoylglutathione lyase